MIKVAVDLPRHDHHPEVENRINEFEREGRFPAITYNNQSDGRDKRQRGENLQIVLCVNQARVLMLFPRDSFSTTQIWQLSFTLPETPYNCNAVSINPVNQSTKRMKLPTIRMPGSSFPCAMRTWIRKKNVTPRALTTTMYGKSLRIYRVSIKLDPWG